MSGETKFTEQPFEVISHSWAEIGVYARYADKRICLINIEDWGVTEETQEAFEAEAARLANLFAASPELYAALEAMCDGTDDMLEWAALVQRGREALRKARGESQ